MPRSALIHMPLGHLVHMPSGPPRWGHCSLPAAPQIAGVPWTRRGPRRYIRAEATPQPSEVADILERYRWFIVGVLALPLAVGAGFLLKDRLDGPDPLQLDLPPDELRVYVTGAVQRPGVYPLNNGERWIDALDAAGGPTEDADLAAVDLARRAPHHETVMVPRLGQTAVSGVSQGPLMDINVAPAE